MAYMYHMSQTHTDRERTKDRQGKTWKLKEKYKSNRQIDKHKYRQKDKQFVRQQKERQTGRQTGGQTERQVPMRLKISYNTYCLGTLQITALVLNLSGWNCWQRVYKRAVKQTVQRYANISAYHSFHANLQPALSAAKHAFVPHFDGVNMCLEIGFLQQFKNVLFIYTYKTGINLSICSGFR